VNLIIETDLGHDPDDFFAICYLVAAGVNVRAITIVPGDPDQVAVARLLCRVVGLDAPIGASKLGRTELSSGGVHHELLLRRGLPMRAAPDGAGKDVVADAFRRFPDSELFIIGPATSVGQFLKENPAFPVARATMQRTQAAPLVSEARTGPRRSTSMATARWVVFFWPTPSPKGEWSARTSATRSSSGPSNGRC
jgi:hypothetical protein